MSEKVSCVHCDRSYEVDFSKGSSIRCFCGKLIRFPEMPSQPPAQFQQQQPNLIVHSSSGSKYPYLVFYCGFIRFCSYCLLVLFVIGLMLGISRDDFKLVNASSQLFGIGLGGLAFAGIIQVLMDIEENTRKK